MRKIITLCLIVCCITSCSTAPIAERLYQACNGDAVGDAAEYDLQSGDAYLWAIEKTFSQSSYSDNKGVVGEGPLENYALRFDTSANTASLVLCVSKTYTDLVQTCPYNSGQRTESRNATYTYSLRIARTGEELINGTGDLIYDREYECPRSLPSNVFKGSGPLIFSPTVSTDPELFSALEPFLTAS